MSTDIKNQLTKIQQNGHNCYEHLKNLVSNLALNQQGLQSFEQYSFSARSKQNEEIVFKVRESYGHMKEFETNNRALLGKVEIGSSPDDRQEVTNLSFLPNLMEEAEAFSRLGVGFGQDETFRIYKSLCNLSAKRTPKSLRLWGKILGKGKDYYIAQGQADGGEDGELAPDTEARGTGVNKLNYWATTSLTDDWIELPLVTPQQIQTSRRIKYLFTGDLEQKILTNPHFHGSEAHLLKCQIVRINATCSIVPKGVYILNESDPKQIELESDPEKITFPDVTQMTGKQNWQYFCQGILKNGRTSHLTPQGEEEEVEKIMKKLNEKDPVEPRLKSVAMDGQNWMIKSVGMEQSYKTIGRNPKTICQGVVGLRNVIWPGWVTAGWEGKYSSIYIGEGYKYKFRYFPGEPESILSECPDREESAIE